MSSTIVEIYGWEKGFQTVSAIQLLVKVTGDNLSHVKRQIESVLDGQTIAVMIGEGISPNWFISEMEKIGAKAKIG